MQRTQRKSTHERAERENAPGARVPKRPEPRRRNAATRRRNALERGARSERRSAAEAQPRCR
eukprot:1874109-Alexandrium_andersonii.AAC.1